MNPSSFLKNYLTETDLKEFVNSNRYLDSHNTIIKTLGLETHYFTIFKRLFPNIPIKKKNIKEGLY